MPQPKLRTGIYGGSFNPIHIGHTQLGVALCSMDLLDELWFLVSPLNPLKENSMLLHDEARLALAQIAVDAICHSKTGGPSKKNGTEANNMAKLRVSDFEMTLPRPSYMVRTLEKMRETYPEREFILVIGADNWLHFDQWKDAREILRHHRIVVYPRPGYAIDVQRLPSNVVLADTPLIDISSTEIRNRIAADPAYDGEGLLPEVWEEIKREGYYTTDGYTKGGASAIGKPQDNS